MTGADTGHRPPWPMPDFANAKQANAARVYDWYMGGSRATPVDRAFGRAVARLLPVVREIVSANHAFTAGMRARASAKGVRQTLHLGCGHPTVSDGYPATYTQRGVREVAVDYDPIVIQERRHRSRGGIGLSASFLDADIRDPDAVLTSLPGRTLNLARPTLLLATAVAHHIPDDQDPAGILARYAAALAPGSIIALSHLTIPDDADDARRLAAALNLYRAHCQPLHPRSRDVLAGWLQGHEPVPVRQGRTSPFLHVAAATTGP